MFEEENMNFRCKIQSTVLMRYCYLTAKSVVNEYKQ